MANVITWLPGSSASCRQASWPPARYTPLPAAPKAFPDWDRLAGLRAPEPLETGMLDLASQEASCPAIF